MDGKRARFRRSDANLSITPKGFRDPSAFPSRGSMRSSSFEKRILSYANPYTGIIRQTECRREWPLEKTLETRLYPIHPFPARPCTHIHTRTRIHAERVPTIVSHAITRSVFWREAKHCREIRNDSKKISVLKRSANLGRLSTARKQGGNLILRAGHAILIISVVFFFGEMIYVLRFFFYVVIKIVIYI